MDALPSTKMRKSLISNFFVSQIGEHLYACNVCNRTFSRKQSMLQHSLLHQDSLKGIPIRAGFKSGGFQYPVLKKRVLRLGAKTVRCNTSRMLSKSLKKSHVCEKRFLPGSKKQGLKTYFKRKTSEFYCVQKSDDKVPLLESTGKCAILSKENDVLVTYNEENFNRNELDKPAYQCKLKTRLILNKNKRFNVYKIPNLPKICRLKVSITTRKDANFQTVNPAYERTVTNLADYKATNPSYDSLTAKFTQEYTEAPTAPNLTYGNNLNNSLSVLKEEENYICELNLQEKIEVKSCLVSYNDEVHIYEAINPVQDNELRTCPTILENEDLHIYEALDPIQVEPISSPVKNEDGLYEALDLAPEDEVKSFFASRKDTFQVYEVKDIVRENKERSYHETAENEHVYEALNMAQDSGMPSALPAYTCGNSHVYDTLNRLAVHRFKIKRNAVSEVLSEVELLPHKDNKKSKNDVCNISFKKKMRPKSYSFKHARDMYECYTCNQEFDDKLCLQKHLLEHLKKNPYVCHECDAAFPEARLRDIHFKTHKNEDLHTCNVCGISFALEDNLTKHLLTHEEEKSHRKEKRNQSFRRMAAHRRSSLKQAVVKKYVCRDCDKAFAVEWCFQSHLLSHSREKHVCCVCQAVFSEKDSLERHLEAHTGKAFNKFKLSRFDEDLKENLPACTSRKVFPFKVAPQKVILRHARVKRNQCDKCGKAFAFKWSLQRHLLAHTDVSHGYKTEYDCQNQVDFDKYTEHHESSLDQMDVKSPKLNQRDNDDVPSEHFKQKASHKICRYKRNPVRRHKCRLCNKEFVMPINLRHHLLDHAKEKSSLVISSEDKNNLTHTNKTVECEERKQIQGHSLLSKHTRKKILKRCFAIKFGFKPRKHRASRIKKHICSICDKEFSMKWSLQCHKLTHTGRKSQVYHMNHTSFPGETSHGTYHYSCNLEDSIVTRSNAENHNPEPLIPKSAPAHACGLCSQVFTKKMLLKVHNLKHIAAKKEVCVVCDKPFAMKWSLQKHLQTHGIQLGTPCKTRL